MERLLFVHIYTHARALAIIIITTISIIFSVRAFIVRRPSIFVRSYIINGGSCFFSRKETIANFAYTFPR